MINYKGFVNWRLALVEGLYRIFAGGSMKTHKTTWPDNFRLEWDSNWDTSEYKSTFNILTNKYSQYESYKYYSLTGLQKCTVSIHKDKEGEPIISVYL
jgi:hypothetical protein